MGSSNRVIEFPPDSPYGPQLTRLVEQIAQEIILVDSPALKVFVYVDDKFEILEIDMIERTDRLTAWLDGYCSSRRAMWRVSRVVVFSERVEGSDKVRYYVVLGRDLPVYTLVVNRVTRQAMWGLQVGPEAELLASKMG